MVIKARPLHNFTLTAFDFIYQWLSMRVSDPDSLSPFSSWLSIIVHSTIDFIDAGTV
jgi:hypothetical protein